MKRCFVIIFLLLFLGCGSDYSNVKTSKAEIKKSDKNTATRINSDNDLQKIKEITRELEKITSQSASNDTINQVRDISKILAEKTMEILKRNSDLKQRLYSVVLEDEQWEYNKWNELSEIFYDEFRKYLGEKYPNLKIIRPYSMFSGKTTDVVFGRCVFNCPKFYQLPNVKLVLGIERLSGGNIYKFKVNGYMLYSNEEINGFPLQEFLSDIDNTLYSSQKKPPLPEGSKLNPFRSLDTAGSNFAKVLECARRDFKKRVKINKENVVLAIYGNNIPRCILKQLRDFISQKLTACSEIRQVSTRDDLEKLIKELLVRSRPYAPSTQLHLKVNVPLKLKIEPATMFLIGEVSNFGDSYRVNLRLMFYKDEKTGVYVNKFTADGYISKKAFSACSDKKFSQLLIRNVNFNYNKCQYSPIKIKFFYGFDKFPVADYYFSLRTHSRRITLKTDSHGIAKFFPEYYDFPIYINGKVIHNPLNVNNISLKRVKQGLRNCKKKIFIEKFSLKRC